MTQSISHSTDTQYTDKRLRLPGEMTNMADIFASPNQPSLFPMIIPCPDISEEEYHLFYKDDRELFTLFLVILHREVVQSIMVMAFFIWLEREGYTSKSLVHTVIRSLPPAAINRVADEAVVCLQCIQKKENNFLFEGSSRRYDISLLQSLVDRKQIHLEEFYANRDRIFDEVSGMANDVSAKAFEDILQHFIGPGGPWVLASPAEVNVGGGVGGYRYMGPPVPFPSYDVTRYFGFYPAPLGLGGMVVPHRQYFMNNYAVEHPYQPVVAVGGGAVGALVTGRPMIYFRPTNLGLNQSYAVRHALSAVRAQEQEEPPENRTIFLTFSKGCLISESELREYFTRAFGDFIEAIYMHEVGPDEQSLHAWIVACSSSFVRAVVERDGPNGKSRYSINGKHVWAWKFEKTEPGRDAAEDAAQPQRK